jgi:hypothetical protein
MSKRVFKYGEHVEVYRDITGFRPEDIGKHGRIIGYIKGDEFPYIIEGYPDMACNWKELRLYKPEVKEAKAMNGTIREKIREVLRSKEDRLLIKHGVISENGNLTDVGRRTMDDLLFGGVEVKDVKAKLVELVKKVDDEEKGSKSK